MLKKEELDSWNSIFPHCKISEADLMNPTESFLTSVLCAYLSEFGCKVELMENAATSVHEKRLFLIKLVHNIDHILKISDKSYAFTYYDLISPTRKKTSTMLSILLNYLHFYNMYKMETIPKAKEMLKTYKELQEKVTRVQHEIQEREKEKEQLDKEIPMLVKEIEELRITQKEAKTEEKKMEDQLKQLDNKLNALNAEKRQLMTQVVSNDEAIALKAELKQSKKKIEENNQKKSRIEKELYERKEHLRSLQDMVQQLGAAKNIISSETLNAMKDRKQQLLDIRQKMQDTEKQKQELNKKIKESSESIKAMEESLQLKRAQYKANFQTENSLLQETERELKIKKKKVADAINEKNLLDVQVKEQMEVREFLEKHIADLNLED